MSESQRFRRATASDVETVEKITHEAYSKWVAVIGREPGPMLADYTVAVSEHQIELLEIGGEVLGLIELIPKDDYLLIENVAVAPAAQGKGLGERLLNRAEEVAELMGLSELRLYTNAAFAQNIDFYGKRGYQEYDRGPIEGGGTVVHMQKEADYIT